MNKDNKNKIQVIVLVVILILVIIFAVKALNKKGEGKKEIVKEKEATSAINPDDPSYAGMKIYKENGDTIIEGEDGAKTIETTKTKKDTGLVEMNEEEKQKYEITNIVVQSRGGGTTITGKIKNNDNKNHTVVIKAKFYSNDNKIKGATNTKLEINKGETKDFIASIMENVSQYKYKIEVEYEK